MNIVRIEDINEAVKNNPQRFPEGYIIELNTDAKKQLVETLKHSSINPKGFIDECLMQRNGELIAEPLSDATDTEPLSP